MESSILLFFIISLMTLLRGIDATSHIPAHHPFGNKCLFVFGDSYADTGNNPISLSTSWNYPYGVTFPGKPAGRFSDGRVLTDFIAKYLRQKTPLAYKFRKFGNKKRLSYGMNFAHGGTGVFNTPGLAANMSTQIQYFQSLINESVFSSFQLRSSVALVTLSGNDYGAFLATNTSFLGLLSFIPTVVNQLALNLRVISKLGVKKIVVTGLQPLGCLPQSTFVSSFQKCNATENSAVQYHNTLLRKAVQRMNKHKNSTPFIILGLYNSFMSVFKLKNNNGVFESPLKPCCFGKRLGDSCGNIDEKGQKLYTLCDDRKSAFFWDSVHPTQKGWDAVYSVLRPTLRQIH